MGSDKKIAFGRTTAFTIIRAICTQARENQAAMDKSREIAGCDTAVAEFIKDDQARLYQAWQMMVHVYGMDHLPWPVEVPEPFSVAAEIVAPSKEVAL